MERKYNVAVTLEERINEVNKLIDNVPNGGIVDADTLLCDVIENADFEVSGLAQDIFNIWLNSSDRASVEALFYDLTDMQLDDFVDLCLDKITCNESDVSEGVRYAVLVSCDREMWIHGIYDSKDEAFDSMKEDFLCVVKECCKTENPQAEDFDEDDGYAYLGSEYAYTNFGNACDWKIEVMKL